MKRILLIIGLAFGLALPSQAFWPFAKKETVNTNGVANVTASQNLAVRDIVRGQQSAPQPLPNLTVTGSSNKVDVTVQQPAPNGNFAKDTGFEQRTKCRQSSVPDRCPTRRTFTCRSRSPL